MTHKLTLNRISHSRKITIDRLADKMAETRIGQGLARGRKLELGPLKGETPSCSWADSFQPFRNAEDGNNLSSM